MTTIASMITGAACRARPLLLAAVAAAVTVSSASFADDDKPGAEHGPNDKRARNVILLIGDGMGDSEITTARNYALGAAGRLALDTLPRTGAYTTYAIQETDSAKPDYVTDSAASGTAWATGVKTSNGRIATAAATDQDLTSILDLARQAGFRTGSVSTADITDATPAVLYAHVASRRCQGPADTVACPQDKKSAGGPGSIAEQAIDHAVDVLLGGGKRRFDQTIDGGPAAGQTVLQYATGRGYRIVTDAAGLAGAQPGQKLLGLFADGNMSVEWSGQAALPAPGSGPQKCLENQRPANEPSLADMTRKALELLAQGGERGFFLQVEGASIDKRATVANACEQIGETVAFDAAVKVALEFAEKHPDTLVVTTADHAHAGQIVPLYAAGPGLLTTLITADDALMKISYGTAGPGASQTHTGTQVRVAAKGPQAGRVVGVTDQTDLFKTLKRAMDMDR